MLEGIADIEAEAYRLLRTMGASPLTKVIRSVLCMYERVLAPPDLCCSASQLQRHAQVNLRASNRGIALRSMLMSMLLLLLVLVLLVLMVADAAFPSLCGVSA